MAKKFELGIITVTAPVRELMQKDISFMRFVQVSLGKHINGNWGDISAEDKLRNDEDVVDGGQILSSYSKKVVQNQEESTVKIWIVTEADRSSTTIMFPTDY